MEAGARSGAAELASTLPLPIAFRVDESLLRVKPNLRAIFDGAFSEGKEDTLGAPRREERAAFNFEAETAPCLITLRCALAPWRGASTDSLLAAGACFDAEGDQSGFHLSPLGFR